MGFPILESFDYYASTSVNTGLLSRWSNQSGGGGPSLIAGRFGGQALRMTDGTGATSFIRRQYVSSPHSNFSIGFAWRHNSAGTAFGNGGIVRLESAAATQLSIYADGNGGLGTVIRVYRGLGTTLLVQATTLIAQSAWNYISINGVINQTAGWVELRINGDLQGRFDGDTAALAGITMDGILLGCVDHSGSGNAQDFDDLFVADVSTNFGACRFECPRPSADTADKDFTRSTGADNFALVDDATFSATDYVESGVLNDYDLYELTNLSSNPQTIHAVKPIVCAIRTDAGIRKLAAVLDSGGTLNTSADINILNDYLIFDGQTLLTNPNGGGVWTGGAVDALKLGPKVSV